VDAAVDVRFGGKIDDGAGLVLGKQAADEVKVADVALDEGVARIALQAGEVLEVAGVGQRVEVDDRLVDCASQSMTKLLPMKPAAPVTRGCGPRMRTGISARIVPP
jgi:hypothetical protein